MVTSTCQFHDLLTPVTIILLSVKENLNTPYNVGSVLWRLFSTLEVVQYIGGITSVLWGDSFSTVEVVQYSGGTASVLWGIASVLWRLFSTVGG